MNEKKKRKRKKKRKNNCKNGREMTYVLGHIIEYVKKIIKL